MKRWKMILRKTEPIGTLAIESVFCEAETMEKARQIFENTYGVTRIVAGPLLVD
jgi:hypothetical protein